MKTVKLTIDGLPIDDVIRKKGDVVSVPDLRAEELIRLGHAEPAAGPVANPDTNMLADVIDPMPPEGVILPTPAPTVASIDDNPGLRKLDEVTDGDAKKKAARLPTKVV